MKKYLLCILMLAITGGYLHAQTATVSYPFSIGRNTTCGSSGTQELHYYTYSSATNTIANASGGVLNAGVPQLRIGTTGGGGGAQRFTAVYSSVSFNPKDHKIYFFWTAVPPALGGSDPNVLTYGGTASHTFVWRWPVGTIPTGTSPRLDTIASFKADILGVAFDNNGNGYDVEFTSVSAPYKPFIRLMDFATGTFGGADTLALTGGATIYQQGSGDVAMTPSGQMFFVVDNKLFTPNYTAYTGTGSNLTCTYIDTVKITGNFVGLTYADGTAIAAFSGGGCPYQKIDLLTAANTVITKSGAVNSSVDMATVVSGIGAAKKLVSTTYVSPGVYDVVYDIYVRNYGNMDVNNVQVTDDLTAINGAANVSNVTTSFVSNPAGLVLNPSFNGNSDKNLLNGTGVLPNYPVAKNNVTIRIACRLKNIVSGTVYNNSATVTAIDWNNNNLKDVSTNGSLPDLNNNDKPDDVNEDQPTPLLISIVPQTPPCASLTNIMYTQNFGSGTGLTTTIPAPVLGTGVLLGTGTSLYTGSTTAPIPVETYSITNNPNTANNAYFLNFADHTGNANGSMLIVNADAASNVMYKATFSASTCSSQQYSLSFYAAFVGNSSYQTLCGGFGGFVYPKIKMRIRDGATGLIITEVSTPNITSTTWQQYGLKFISPASYSSIIIELINDAPGGCGNDVAIDDIQYGTCDALPIVNISAVSGGCLGGISTFSASLNDPSALPGTKDYQWQVSTDNVTWVDIVGATSATYVINPVGPLNVNKYYRVLVAASGNILSPTCRYTSPGYYLTAKTPSTAPTGAKANKNNVCPGNTITLTVQGGTLGTNATWKWYSGSCGGTYVGTGASITVNPTVATTYFVRAEGDCNNTTCASVTINISCDIDKDKDGIPDFVESNIPAALQDADGDGIINAYDTDYPGFVDNNGDFINDNFQADGDSDGDGILNYMDHDFLYNGLPWKDVNGDGINDYFDNDLDGIINMLDLDSDNDGIPDVVEAGGVDANGDGKIDNFTDTDGDGLSQNVDKNNSGAFNSGIGLGAVDTDGDGVPNEFDLDSDNDGIPDVIEVGAADVNHDGKVDGFVDANNDGIADNIVGVNALLKTGADINNDGKADSYPYKNMDGDKRANPYDLDSDGDGIVDVIEAGFADANYDGFIDGPRSADGWNTAKHGVALNLINTDGNGNPDYLDIDSDDDGIPDNIEGQSTNGYKLPTYSDVDNDGIDDAYDLAPFANSFGGSGIFVYDFDMDGIPDYRDLDTDSDGVPDRVEGNDFNHNGIGDDLTTLLNTDVDGDGLDDRFDSLNTGPKGTSYNMGAGGTTLGDPAPGTRAPVQKTLPIQPDRDWRYAGYLLNVQLLKFEAYAQSNDNVYLTWKLITSQALNRFEIERSTDNRTFTKVATLTKEVPLQQELTFSLYDNIASVTNDIIFYRLKIIAANNQVKYSNVLLIRKGNAVAQNTATLQPNPASDYVSIHFYSSSDCNAMVRLIDNLGKTVLMQQQRVINGTNNLQLSGLSKYSNGAYTIQVQMKDDVITQKLIISNR
ncbi:MAG: T9SS type A sorting domain-containing protein [Bacteroidetes bacterium]|nr:T9SS type A sorting domain-containing protein [Bacteroidota bacterium]